ncbi:MAG: acylphosphatase [Saprospiraceae bacterium]|nr:acylphosphatase [Saprospiraceae bacterium]
MSDRFVQIIVKGKVQGVSYRHYSRLQARALGLKGWVCNRDDGDVCIFAGGRREAVDALIQWCHRGSPQALVREVLVTAIGAFEADDFEIRV